jgi:arylsulfatase A-like enzyme
MITMASPRTPLVTALGLALSVSLLAGCGKDGEATAAAKSADEPLGGDVARPAKRAPSRGPERVVYSLVDNRLAAHLERGGGLFVPAGSAGLAKYVRFGNTRKIKQRTWELRATEGGVRVGKLTGSSGRVDVPLTAELIANPVVRIRAFSNDARALSLRVNEHGDINAQLPGGGWSTVEVPVPAGQLRAGENQLLLFVRGAGLPVEWIQVGGQAPLEGAAAFYDDASKSLVIPEGGAMTWYTFVPDAGRITADLADGACEIAVRAVAEDGATADGTLSGLGSAVELGALAGKAARLTLSARGCPRAQLAGAALVVPGEPPQVARGEPPRHVILLVMDSLRADRVRPFNPKARPEVPVWEELAATSAVFLQHYVQGNESRVSHASLWSSLYPIKHGMIGAKDKLDLAFTTVDEVAKSAGLYVAGVSANGYVEPKRWGFGTKWDRYANHIHEKLGLRGKDIFDKGWSFVADRQDPWFLYMGWIDTHVSWRAKSPWIEQYSPGYTGRFKDTFSGQDAGDAASGKLKLTEREIEHVRALYDSNVSYQDELLGQLIGRLKEAGIWEQTMLIITADHGDEQWEDGRVGHGASTRDMLIHVPLLVHYPPMLPGGKIVEGADVVDVVPTIADALGVPMDPAWQGESLIPLSAGVGRGYPRMSFMSMYEDAHAARILNWKVRLAGGNPPRVYDLARDPDEKKDLWGKAEASIGARAVLDPAWIFRSWNAEWKKSQWGNAANVSARFATDLGE